jgi:16S rRNA pseudouridine516 synthase
LLGEADIAAFADGLHIKDSDGEFDAKPAGLEIVSEKDGESEVRVRVSEGKYHQVKRMLASRGAPVVYLKREQIGALKLDPLLEPGQWREMTDEEVQLLEQEANDA